MKETIQKASRDYTLLFYHVDQKHDLSISSLFDFYTEIALTHTLKAGYTFRWLEEKNLKWILYKMVIRVNRYPRIGENIRVSTWGDNIIKFNAFRRYDVTDENGEVLSTAEGIWLMVNADTMRPVRIPDEMFDGYGVDRGNKNRFEIESLNNLVNGQNGDRLKVVLKKDFTVHYADLDYNQHATSARYADWALETIPYEIRTGYDLSELVVNYFKELKYGDPVQSVCTPFPETDIEDSGEKIFQHGIYSGDEKPATLMRSIWKKRMVY
jgi:medium-chain acyl-[acyl-carrier-protein] hydrolase